jgi:hypothetical protein
MMNELQMEINIATKDEISRLSGKIKEPESPTGYNEMRKN